MATTRKQAKTGRQAPKAARKVPLPPAKPKGRPAAPKQARKPTPQPSPPAKPAKAAAKPPAAPKAVEVDPFDPTPTLPIPGVYHGWIRKKFEDGIPRMEGGHTCIAYRRTDFGVSTILAGQPIRLHEWNPADFDKYMRPARKDGGFYPVERAVQIHLRSYNGWTDKALKALKQLRDGKEVDLNGEDAIDDIISLETPEKTVKVHRQALGKEERRRLRKLRRQRKLAAMNPKERKEWMDKRNARRKQRKQARLAGKG
jgi:hypothetical protein